MSSDDFIGDKSKNSILGKGLSTKVKRKWGGHRTFFCIQALENVTDDTLWAISDDEKPEFHVFSNFVIFRRSLGFCYTITILLFKKVILQSSKDNK